MKFSAAATEAISTSNNRTLETSRRLSMTTTMMTQLFSLSTTINVATTVLVFLSLSHFLSIGFVDATSIKMDFLPIGHARVDPILNNECVSDHVHAFYGPQGGVDPRFPRPDGKSLYETLVSSDDDTNTGNVVENKSLYWHPSAYKYDRATNTYTRDVMAQTSAYYIWETGEASAFPNEFEMIGGLDPNLSFANAECVNERPCDDEEDAGHDNCYTENSFFPASKCDELEVSMRMPNCWDGVSLNSPETGHTGHVAYSFGSEFDSECPDSHPVKLPQIQLFFRIAPYNGGWHTFSDGSSVFHADYVSGWNSTFLQKVLDECDNEGGGAMPNFFCEEFLTYRDGPKCTDENTCDFGDPVLLEKLKAIQPKFPLDIAGTIVSEETKIVKGNLPRTSCNGSLVVRDSNNNNNDPTPVPTTKLPTLSPTLAPSVSNNDNDEDENPLCVDDSNLRYKNKRKKNCNWVRKSREQRCGKIWEGKRLEEHCPKACQLETICPFENCENEPDSVGTFQHKKKTRNCLWVQEKLNKRCKKNKLRKKCPETCNANGCIKD